jgi:hypothetical protein
VPRLYDDRSNSSAELGATFVRGKSRARRADALATPPRAFLGDILPRAALKSTTVVATQNLYLSHALTKRGGPPEERAATLSRGQLTGVIGDLVGDRAPPRQEPFVNRWERWEILGSTYSVK